MRSSGSGEFALSDAPDEPGLDRLKRPLDPLQLSRHLLLLGLSVNEIVPALSEAEVDTLYAQLIADGSSELTVETLRARPTRRLFEHLMSHSSFNASMKKTLQFICRNEDVAQWVREVLSARSAEARRFARQLR